jgi:hypothetical protein
LATKKGKQIEATEKKNGSSGHKEGNGIKKEAVDVIKV